MKKLATLILALALCIVCAFAFTACGGNGNTDNSGGNIENTNNSSNSENEENEENTDNKGNVEDKTEDTDEDEDEDNTEDKTEDNETEDNTNNNDNTSDKDESNNDNNEDNDNNDEDNTEDTNEDETVSSNKYAEIITALQARIETENGFENAEILTILEDNNYLTCKVKVDAGYYTAKVRVSTDGYSLTADIIDTNYYISNITDAKISTTRMTEIGVYNVDGTAEEKLMVESMIDKLLSDGYTVMWGTISAAQEKGDDAVLGTYSQFTVYALLEKDGAIYEYKETISVTKDLNHIYGNVYQSVLKSTEANKEKIYRSESKEFNDLGEVAALYFAECNK